MAPVFSIIIPAHNEENYIRKTLHSIKQQTFQNYEVLVVANGCTDKTEQIVQKRGGEKVRLHSIPRANVCAARNTGALNATARTLVFLDADTTLAPDALQKIKSSFNEKHSVATTKVHPDNKLWKHKLVTSIKNFSNSTGIYEGCGGILICRKEDFHKASGYNADITLREHRRLIKKLMTMGEYTCINTHVTTSMRRYEQWGVIKTASFWAAKWLQDYSRTLKDAKYEQIR
jgi:glycosyltransferase involved in cell wall biosynthesis